MVNGKDKRLIVMGVFLLALTIGAVYHFDLDLSSIDELNQGSIISQSEIVTREGNHYWVISFTQKEYTTDKILTKKIDKEIDKQLPNGSKLKGEISGEFKLKIDDDNMGWQTDLGKHTSPKYVDYLEDTRDSWSLLHGDVSLDHEYSDSGFNYYTLEQENWNYMAQYEAEAVIGDKKYTTMIGSDNGEDIGTGVRYSMGTEPDIYYEEFGLLNSRDTQTPPDFNEDYIVIPYERNNGKMFMSVEDKTLTEIIDTDSWSWNNVMDGSKTGKNGLRARDYLDTNNDGEYVKSEDIDNIDERFSVEDVCENNYGAFSTYSDTKIDIQNPEDYEVTPQPDYDQYSVNENRNKLQYKTPIMVGGSWYIPIEYGDVRIEKLKPEPEIVGYDILGKIYDEGTAKLQVDIKNNGETGQVDLEINENNNTEHVTFTPLTETVKIESGQTKTVNFTINGNDITNLDKHEGDFDIIVFGSGGAIDKVTASYTVHNTDNVDESDKAQITIFAKDINGNDVDYPIIVHQNDDRQAGIWKGEVIKGEVYISGVETDGMIPQSKTINVNSDGQEFVLTYTPTTGGYGGVDYEKWILIVLGILFMTGLGYGVYRYMGDDKK